MLDALDEAFDELPEEQREVFVAHELVGRSFKEIVRGDGRERKHPTVAEEICGAASA